MDNKLDEGKFVVSEGILNDGTFGIYFVPEENTSLEYRLFGGCGSLDEAREKANEIIPELPVRKDEEQQSELVAYRKRQKAVVDSIDKVTKIEDIVELIQEKFDRSVAELTKTKILKRILSYDNLIFLILLLAIWLFWKGGSFIIPKDLDFPLIGSHLGGTVLDAQLLARYFPVAILILYAAKFFALIKTNLEYDLLRRKVLALVFNHGWRFRDFVFLLAHSRKSMEKGGLGWLMSVSDWFSDLDPARLGNLRNLAGEYSEVSQSEESKQQIVNANRDESIPGNVRHELDQKLKEWIPDEFERRIHNLYFLDKEKDYSRFVICFDPLIYITSLNRVIFNTYEFLRQKGLPVDQYNAPRDPYLIQRVTAPVFWISVVFQVLLFGGVMIWSLFISGIFDYMLFFTKIVAIALVMVVPNWWNYLAVMNHRGYPKSEPLGAYTVGPLTPNRLSLL